MYRVEPPAQDGEPPESNIKPYFDPEFTRSVRGICLLVQVCSTMAAFISVVLVHYAFWAVFLGSFVGIVGFCVSVIILSMYLFHLVEITMYTFHWPKWETIFYGVWSVLFLLVTATMIYAVVTWPTVQLTWGISAGFSFIAFIAYVIAFLTMLQTWQQGRPPQLTVIRSKDQPTETHYQKYPTSQPPSYNDSVHREKMITTTTVHYPTQPTAPPITPRNGSMGKLTNI